MFPGATCRCRLPYRCRRAAIGTANTRAQRADTRTGTADTPRVPASRPCRLGWVAREWQQVLEHLLPLTTPPHQPKHLGGTVVKATPRLLYPSNRTPRNTFEPRWVGRSGNAPPRGK